MLNCLTKLHFYINVNLPLNLLVFTFKLKAVSGKLKETTGKSLGTLPNIYLLSI